MALVYSCCFWFSLRLGGIIIGIFSFFQALLVLIGIVLAYTHTDAVKMYISEWTHNLNLIYAKEYLENFKAGPGKYLSFSITVTCLYMILCLMFIYGAYTCNNIMMISYILVDLIYLIILSMIVATVLLLIKLNTTDIGLLIGASVAGGFFLLGKSYLWICTANLPILINEMEREGYESEVTKLRQLLEVKNRTFQEMDRVPFAGLGSVSVGPTHPPDVFMVPNRVKNNVNVRYPRPAVSKNVY